MTRHISCHHAPPRRKTTMPLRALTLALACALLSAPAWAVEVHGFLEPYRTVDVATTETGIMIQLLVRVGDPIGEGEVIAQLDDDVHQILVETAKAKTEAQGRLASAQAELKLRKYRLAKLAELIEQGHGRREEVERAAADARSRRLKYSMRKTICYCERWSYVASKWNWNVEKFAHRSAAWSPKTSRRSASTWLRTTPKS